ncbi:cysteine methyltransferase [Chitinophaga agrisoli]|uniref:Cysteine methyltransferase n=2 Tax=Chitinophaga agrisoli TaxID=2607653 RepID=A0A5B2W0S4_9BACT|nr:cysteine methyltransferase [Chitinophaga agrisoli]
MKERLMPVKPSGKKDEPVSMVDLIHDLVRHIPKGRVTSYGAVAKVLGVPNPRMVGHAMGVSASNGKAYPAHRVVNSAGRLSGGHQDGRKQALEKEGVVVKGDKIIDFKTLFWDPAVEL